ncbi:MAG TPA: sulfite reductase [Gammaproteobacteria bacterium]|nr:sulfite reductase [Gammaproteobacteria bacterium]
MTTLIEAVLKAQTGELKKDPKFPHAPDDWSQTAAMNVAKQDGLTLSAEHWDVVRALQEYYDRHREATINLRELHDALDEKFHEQGGIRHLYQILPGGPVVQGCRIAGLTPPAGATDKGFGSRS